MLFPSFVKGLRAGVGGAKHNNFVEEDKVLLASSRVIKNKKWTAMEYGMGVKKAIRLLQAATGTI
jgi:hypothetical protein